MAITTLGGLSSLRSEPTISPIRRLKNHAWWTLCAVGLLLLVAPVFWIIIGVCQRAFPVWSWSVFTEVSTGIGGGLSNAIVGTFVITFGVAIIAGFLGIGSGIFLAELSRKGKMSMILRSASEVLAGIPSIVFGYCGYLVLVVGLHWGYSLLPALIVLGLLVVPYIAKSTELALSHVPLGYREGGEALGMTTTYVLRRVVMRTAIPGILTGLILALAISIGETAPLIYTASYSNSYPTGALIHQSVGYLTYAAYEFYDQPGRAAQNLSADAALLLVVIVLIAIIASRIIVRVTQKYAPDRGR